MCFPDIICETPNIPNAQVVSPEHLRTHYEVSSRIIYKCFTGFEPQQLIHITCNSPGQWTNLQACTGKLQLTQLTLCYHLSKHHISAYCSLSLWIKMKLRFVDNYYRERKILHYANLGKWVHTSRSPYRGKYFVCDVGYKTFSGNWWGASTCKNGRWSNELRCIRECFPKMCMCKTVTVFRKMLELLADLYRWRWGRRRVSAALLQSLAKI